DSGGLAEQGPGVRGAWVRRERLGKKDVHRRGPGLHPGTGPVGAIWYAGDRLRLPPEGPLLGSPVDQGIRPRRLCLLGSGEQVRSLPGLPGGLDVDQVQAEERWAAY